MRRALAASPAAAGGRSLGPARVAPGFAEAQAQQRLAAVAGARDWGTVAAVAAAGRGTIACARERGASGCQNLPPTCQPGTFRVSNRAMAFPLSWLATAEPSLPDAAAAPAAGAAFDALLLGQQDRLRRLVHRLLGFGAAATEVDDLVQDVLLAAWRDRRGFRGDASLGTWLTRIAIRRVQRHARWARVRRWLVPFAAGGDELPAAAGACPVETAESVAALRTALARLRHADREILVLHYLEARAVDELAALLGCARNAIEQRLSRARTRLGAALAGGRQA